MPARPRLRATLQAVVATWLTVVAGCAPPPERDPGPARLAVLAPAAAEIVDRLGLADRVVAIGDFVDRPERLTDLPRIGAYDAPDLERLVELRVDLLITTRSVAASGSHDRMRALGVEVLAPDTETFDGVFSSIVEIGRALGVEDRAVGLAADLRAELDAIGARTAGLPERKVLFVVGRDPLYVAGAGSHVDSLIALGGGVNVAAEAGAPYRRLSLEAALERMPDVIVDTSDNRPGAPRGRTAGTWAEWSFVPAVAENRVWHVEPDRLVIPGVRLPEMAALMARLIHPETFGAPADDAIGGRPPTTEETGVAGPS